MFLWLLFISRERKWHWHSRRSCFHINLGIVDVFFLIKWHSHLTSGRFELDSPNNVTGFTFFSYPTLPLILYANSFSWGFWEAKLLFGRAKTEVLGRVCLLREWHWMIPSNILKDAIRECCNKRLKRHE